MTRPERDDETGRFAPAPDRDRDDLLAAMTPGEPHTTSELATALDWPRRTVYKFLRQLADDGHIRKKQINARTVIWIRDD